MPAHNPLSQDGRLRIWTTYGRPKEWASMTRDERVTAAEKALGIGAKIINRIARANADIADAFGPAKRGRKPALPKTAPSSELRTVATAKPKASKAPAPKATRAVADIAGFLKALPGLSETELRQAVTGLRQELKRRATFAKGELARLK